MTRGADRTWPDDGGQTRLMASICQPPSVRRVALHWARFLLLVTILLAIRMRHRQFLTEYSADPLAAITQERIREFFPRAAPVGNARQRPGKRVLFDRSGQPVGYLIQTAPGSDHRIGFSGPTNVMIALTPDDRIVGIDLLASGDTKEHVERVLSDNAFLDSFTGLSREAAAARRDVDAVSGATLTSLAIQAAIIGRLGGGRPSLRFPDPVTVEEASLLFLRAASIERDPIHQSLWHIRDANGQGVGSILRTAPAADNIIGYQGPTDTWIGFGPDDRVVGIWPINSYDNDPYIGYVRADGHFLTMLNDRKLEELATLDLKDAEIEGVSGATMTSMAVAESVITAADEHRQALAAGSNSIEPKSLAPNMAAPSASWPRRDATTAAMVVAGLTIALTSLRRKKWLRISFQLLLIGILGLIQGDMLSQAMVVGWAQNGIPWRTAGGLFLLTVAALLVPLMTGPNVYCTHLCPHGAAQALLRNRFSWHLHVPLRWSRLLRIIPPLLIGWCILVAMVPLPLNLIAIEPFDAWLLSVAGWATITVALSGLAASLVVPMAYCRYGCPTGALLGYFKFKRHGRIWSTRDFAAILLLALTIALL
jgi:NosR/NirI family transcriptional regulator, nitrous oxide reductase regulator